MNKTFEQLGFKVGDRVRCVAVSRSGTDFYKVGGVYPLRRGWDGGPPLIDSQCDGRFGDWELITPEIKTLYEVNGKQYDTREKAEAALGPVVVDVVFFSAYPKGLSGSMKASMSDNYKETRDRANRASRIDRIELLSDGSTRIIQDVKE